MNKKFLLVILIPVSSILLGLVVFFISQKYVEKMPEVFQEEPYPDTCPAGSSCTGCSQSCSVTNNTCSGQPVCTFSYCTCYADGTTCGPYCEQTCPPGCTASSSGNCSFTCSPCINSQSCDCLEPSAPPSAPPSAHPSAPPSAPP